MSILRRAGGSVIAAAALALTAPAFAQHSDVEVGVEGSALTIENGELMTNGSVLFEAEFGELGNPFETDEPGFELDDGLFNEGEILAFEALGSLQAWNGSEWSSAAVPESVAIVATDILGMDTEWVAGGVSNAGGLIDAADPEGGVHSHIEFSISNAGTDPVPGAYLIEFQLFGLADDQMTQLYGHSGSMFVAFNFGLEEEDFEMAVEALLAAPVPVPGAVVLMLSGLLSMFGLRRRSAA